MAQAFVTGGMVAGSLVVRGFGGAAPVILPYDLFEAAIAWLKANAASSFPGGFSSGPTTAAKAALGVHARLLDIPGPKRYLSSGTWTADGILQVSAFAPTRSAAKRAADAAMDALSDAPLAFARGQILNLRPGDEPRVLDPPDLSVGGANLYQGIVQMSYTIVSKT